MSDFADRLSKEAQLSRSPGHRCKKTGKGKGVCDCKSCVSRRNQRKGREAQRNVRKQLRLGKERFTGLAGNEETWRRAFRFEVKNDKQAMRVIANHQLGLAELNTMHPVVGYAKLDTETVMLVTADHLAACVNGGTAPASYGAQPREARTAVSMYRRTHAQSEKAKAIGDARPFVCAAAPAKGMLVCLIAEEDWQAVQEALREEWSSSDG